jgi:hypothetical protein
MRLKLIACKVLQRRLASLVAASPNAVDLVTLNQDFHNYPDRLRSQLQAEIDMAETENDPHSIRRFMDRDYDAIVVGYGLCSNAVLGLTSSRIPIVLPRIHDCVSFLLGSKERYREYFDSHPGIFWYDPGWIENSPMPGKDYYDFIRKDYTEKYGEDNAEYLIETELGWNSKYSGAVYVTDPELDNAPYEAFTRDSAAYLNWGFDRLEGDPSLLHDLVNGPWSQDRFLVLKPGATAEASWDDTIVKEAKVGT